MEALEGGRVHERGVVFTGMGIGACVKGMDSGSVTLVRGQGRGDARTKRQEGVSPAIAVGSSDRGVERCRRGEFTGECVGYFMDDVLGVC